MKLKILSVFFLSIIFISFVSAFEFDNVKSYDAVSKEIIIKNAYGLPELLGGKDIAKVKLLTDLDVRVGAGYQKVAEFEITSYEQYEQAIKTLELYNIKEGMKQIERKIDFKYKTLEEVEINDYEPICEKYFNEKNGTNSEVCTNKLIGSHFEKREVWKDLSSMDMKIETLTIGLFTNVEIGDKIEWIPNLYGVRVEEWASWTTDLNVDLVSYYKLDEINGTVIYDSLNVRNATTSGTTLNVTGKINNSNRFIYTNSAFDNLGNNPYGFSSIPNWTISLWVYYTSSNVGGTGTQKTNGMFSFGGNQSQAGENRLYVNQNEATFHSYDGAGQVPISYSLSNSQWYFITVRMINGNFTYWVNGTLVGSNYDINDAGKSFFDSNFVYKIIGGDWVDNNVGSQRGTMDGYVDELGIWKRALSTSEISYLYNNGTGMTYLKGPTVTLNSPINNYNSSNSLITFNSSVIGNSLINITHYDNSNGTFGPRNITLISGNSNSSIITNNYSDGTYVWNSYACDIISCSFATSNYTFFVDTGRPIIVANLTNTTLYAWGNNMTLNYNVTDNPNLTGVTCWYNYNNTNTTLNCSQNQKNITTVTGFYNIVVYANDSVGNNATPVNLSFVLDSIPPTIQIISGNGTQNYGILTTNHSLSYNITDTNLASCWLNYNGTNRTIPCTSGAINTTSFTLVQNLYNATVFANDTAGNLANNTLSWNYKIFELNQTYSNLTSEGNIEDFSVLINTSYEISSAVFIYNGTQYSTVIKYPSLSLVNITEENFIIPEVSVNTNVSLYWKITLADSTQINLSTKNQTVYNLGIDNCSVYTNRILNLSLKDEELQTPLNGTVEVLINLYSKDRKNLVVSTGQKFQNSNVYGICLNINLTGSVEYSMDSTIKYYSTDYAIEYYNIVNSLLNSNNQSQNINLYDLNNSVSTNFVLTFTGTDFLPSADTLVFVERQYVSENTFKTVEIPKTDTNGQTILHLVKNDVVYNLKFMKDGILIKTFTNLRAFCTDYTIGDCVINLNAISDTVTYSYENQVGIAYESPPTFNDTTNRISFSYVSTDGNTKNVTLNVQRNDEFGNITICTNSVNSISGTLSCDIGTGIEDTSLRSTIVIDGEPLVISTTIIDSTGFGSIGYVVWFFLSLILILLSARDKNFLIISILVSYVGAISIGIAVGGVIGIGSAGVWIIIVTLVALWRVNKNKQG